MNRQKIDILERQFDRLHRRWEKMFASGNDQIPGNLSSESIIQVIRAAAIVEQAFGGMTSSLWDDPFEWTLPEAFGDSGKLRLYFREVKEAIDRGFACLKDDAELSKNLITPFGEKVLGAFLEETLSKAEDLTCKAEPGA
ncbi:MAG: hypothetical protein R2684_06730 [Pyrinomonadaceae bacterium]